MPKEENARAETFSVIVPVHREGKYLRRFVEDFREELRVSGLDGSCREIILAENHSPDETADVCLLLASESGGRVKTFSLPKVSRGLALKKGIEAARGEYVFLLDCDDLNTAFVREAWELLQSKKADFVTSTKRQAGSRDLRPWPRKLFTFAYNKLLSRFTGYPGTDTHGAKAIETSLAKHLCGIAALSDASIETEIVLIAWKLGKRVLEIPVRVREKRPARSHPLRRLPRRLLALVKIRRSLRRFSGETKAVRQRDRAA